MTSAQAALGLCLGLALGSVPFGLLLTRAAGLGDIRNIGSGNIGATNVLRTGRRDLAALTLLLDGGKGAVAVLLSVWLIAPDTGELAGIGSVTGHLFSPWLGFSGGKGVATGLGVLLGAMWPVGLVACAIWLLSAVVTKISSLSALVAFFSAPFIAYAIWDTRGALLAFVIAAMVAWRHHANIGRLLAGTEPRIGAKR